MKTEIATSFYYAFSTIAQVLAAFLALSGVFLILILQQKKKLIVNQAEKIRLKTLDILKDFKNDINIPDSDEIKKTLARLEEYINNESVPFILKELDLVEKHDGLAKMMNTLAEGKFESFEKYQLFWVLKFAQINRDKRHRNKALKSTKKSFIAGFLSIVLSISFLPQIPLVSNCFIYCGLGITFILFFYSIISMLYVVILSLNVEYKITPD
jgi:hypothetical protein